jgi:hypothetical protein
MAPVSLIMKGWAVPFILDNIDTSLFAGRIELYGAFIVYYINIYYTVMGGGEP